MNTALQQIQFALPVGNLDAYIAATRQIPSLTLEEEQALASRWHHYKDVEAAKQLTLSHLRFVVNIAKKYMGYGLMLADLIQEGNIGLMKAVKRFDPTMGVRLVSFAIHWIKAEIHEFILRNWRIVKMATTKVQRKLFFKLRGLKERMGNNHALIAKNIGVKPSAVSDMDNRLMQSDACLDAVYDIVDQNADPAKYIDMQTEFMNHQTEICRALETLDDRSKDILTKRWLSEEKVTLEILAKNYGVSKERIRQLEESALRKLRLFMTMTAD